MSTNHRRAEIALREARASLSRHADLVGWPSHVEAAYRLIRDAENLLATADLEDCARWLRDEQCAVCGRDADVIDEVPYCAAHYEKIQEREAAYDAEVPS